MNFKKLKRLLSVVLSVSMVLSSNMVGFAAELVAPEQVESVAEQENHEHDWQLQTVIKEATADQPGMGTYVCECGETKMGAIEQIAPAADDGAADDTQTPSEEPDTSTEPGVAKIGDTEYATLGAALTAAPANAEITLLSDAVLNSTATYELDTKKVNTAGYTITVAKGAAITLNDGTFTNSVAAAWPENPAQRDPHVMLNTEAGSTLTINNGTYSTKGVEALFIQGNATVNGAAFTCTAAADDIKGQSDYDGASLLAVNGGVLNMPSGTINADVGNGNNGMYGIYLYKGGKLELGAKDAANGPEITSRFAAVGLNATLPDASITIHGGKYRSTVACTPQYEKFNAVLYLSANSNVNITGGTFQAAAPASGSGKTSVITTPLTAEYADCYRNITITGGTFQAGSGNSSIFYNAADDMNQNRDMVSLDITGGTFSEDISDYLFGGYQASGSNEAGWTVGKVNDTAVVTVNGTGYDSLHAALTKAAEIGTADKKASVKLLHDVSLTGENAYNLSNVTIETDGHTIRVKDGARIVLNGATVNNQVIYSKTAPAVYHGVIDAEKGSFLKIVGGAYTTKAVKLLTIRGNVIIDKNETYGTPTFTCTATNADMPNNQEVGIVYDTMQLLQVVGGTLEMLHGTVNTEAILNTAKNCGMHGLSIQENGAAILGTENAQDGPVIHAAFHALGLNNTVPAVTARIYSGEYTSLAHCTASNELQYNAVIYLSANSDVQISGGKFEVKGLSAADTNAPVITIPYGKLTSPIANVKLNITGGTFTTTGDKLFNVHAQAEQKIVRGGTFSTDPTAYCAAGYTAAKGTDGTYTVTKSAECTHKDGTTSLLVFHDYEAPDCTKEGSIAYYECTNCLKKFADQECQYEITTDVILPKKDHVAQKVAATTATCTEPAHKEHYVCINCGKKYLSIPDMKIEKEATNTDIDEGSALGHDYTKKEYVFGWPETTEFENETERTAFNTAVASGVTVSKKCDRCQETEALTDKAAVTGGTLPTGFKCTSTGAKVAYTATLTPSTGDPITGTKEIALNYETHAWGNATFAAASGFNAFVKGTKITATRTCSVCQEQQTTETVAISPAMRTSCEDYTDTFTLTATFGEGETTETAEGTQSITVKASAHSLTYVPYQAADCDSETDGNYAYYRCATCGKRFWSPNQTNTALTDEDIKIPKITHNFGLPKFDWENDGTTKTAKAVFTCMKCHGTVTISGLEVEKGVPQTQGATCTDMVDLNYPVSVHFDKTLVGSSTGLDDFGYNRYSYPANSTEGDLYSGKVTKKEVLGHDFKVETAWIDPNPNTDAGATYYDIEKGVLATLTCQRNGCSGKVTINSTNGKTTVDGTDVLTAHGSVELTLDDSAAGQYKAAGCVSDGFERYGVRVLCRTDDGKGQLSYVSSNDKDNTPLQVETDTKKLGHDWYVASMNDVNWMSSGSSSDPTQAGPVRVDLHCTRDPDDYTRLMGEVDGVTVGTLIADGTTYGSHKLSCTENGIYVWEVTVNTESGAEGKKAITNLGTDGKGDRLIVKRIVTAPGHDYGEGSWNWKGHHTIGADGVASITPGGQVYYEYTCQSTIPCSCKANTANDASDIQNNGTLTDDGTHWIKRIPAEVKATSEPGKEASCTQPGEVTYTAKVTDNGVTRTSDPLLLKVASLGHDWKNAVVEWSANLTPAVDANGDAIMASAVFGGKTYQVPAYTVSVTRTCQECTENDTGGTETKTATLSEADTARNKFTDNAYVVLSLAKAPEYATCGVAGKFTFTAALYDANGNKIAERETPYEVTDPAKVHTYTQDIVIDWTTLKETPQKDNNGIRTGYVLTADAYIPCDLDSTNRDHDFIVENLVITRTNDVNCTQAKVAYKAEINKANTALPQTTLPTGYTGSISNPTFEYDIQTQHTFDGRVPASSADIVCNSPYYPRHYHCTKCGKNYETSAAANEVTISFAPQPHSYGKPVFSVFTTTDGDLTAVATFNCSRCNNQNAVKTKTATVEKDKAFVVEPKCQAWADEHPGEDSNGYTYYPVSVTGMDGTTRYEDEYEVMVPGGDHVLDATGKCKWCEQTFIAVKFLSYNEDQILSTTFYTRDKDSNILLDGTVIDKSGLVIANAPSRVNYDFLGWSIGNSKDPLTSQTLPEKLLTELKTTAVPVIEIKPNYSPSAKTASLTVNKAAKGAVQAAGTPVTVTVGTSYTLQLAEADKELTVDGSKYVFSHWANDVNGDSVLSTSETYDLYIAGETPKTVYAIYIADPKDRPAEPVITMAQVYTSIVDGAYKLSFASDAALPDNATLLDSGFVYGMKQTAFGGMSDAALDAELMLENVGKSDHPYVKQYAVNGGIDANGKVKNILTINLGTTESAWGNSVWVKGYIRYTDKDGVPQTKYTKVTRSSYNEAK